MAIATRKLQCLLTIDDKRDAIAARNEHAEKLKIMGLAPRYTVGLVRGRGRKSRRTWQVWIFDSGEVSDG